MFSKIVLLMLIKKKNKNLYLIPSKRVNFCILSPK
jgi:hypothetical protein